MKIKRIIKSVPKEYKGNESDIWSMATLRKNDTNLPVNLWIDDGGVWKRERHHLPRIKFQKNKNETGFHTRDGIPMVVCDDPYIPFDYTNLKGFELKNSDIEAVKEFVKLNLKDLLKVLNEETSVLQFGRTMKKFGE